MKKMNEYILKQYISNQFKITKRKWKDVTKNHQQDSLKH